ncbi:hypothetical protein BH09BAC4_BH09BAC4_18380 [soil metagenome]
MVVGRVKNTDVSVNIVSEKRLFGKNNGTAPSQKHHERVLLQRFAH